MKTSEFIARVEELGFNVIEKQFIYANEVWLIVREVEHATIMGVEKNTRYMIDIDHNRFEHLDDDTKEELFNIAVEYAKTPVEERKDEKRFIIPLPGLITTDGKQQYLTYKDGFFFVSRRDENLVQTWKEEHLELIPEQYRQFIEERQYDYLYDMYIDEFEDYDEED